MLPPSPGGKPPGACLETLRRRGVDHLQHSASAVRAAAEAVEGGAHSLNQRLQQEATSQEQSSNATAQINASARDNAQRAANAAELAHHVVTSALQATARPQGMPMRPWVP